MTKCDIKNTSKYKKQIVIVSPVIEGHVFVFVLNNFGPVLGGWLGRGANPEVYKKMSQTTCLSLSVCLSVCLTGWLVGWLVGGLVGWLVGR